MHVNDWHQRKDVPTYWSNQLDTASWFTGATFLGPKTHITTSAINNAVCMHSLAKQPTTKWREVHTVPP